MIKVGTLCRIVAGHIGHRHLTGPYTGRFCTVTGYAPAPHPHCGSAGATVDIDLLGDSFICMGCLQPIAPPGNPDRLGEAIDDLRALLR